ncbi:cysteine-rich receptor-like protein kinase 25 [Mangifera indica]|uniref:cysteine-rich receptor-like protein kinase 25 n=1 Tax=Mangifera indica TaxID=29780 RepID=UPI001CFB4974|nr:cysteine-rich receptor-like protein kinase 25 [Mangifera indica]
MSRSPSLWIHRTDNFTGSTDIFGEKVSSLLTEATAEAVNTSKMFAIKSVNFDAFGTLEGLVQCTPDLSKLDCNTCLKEAISELGSFAPHVEARMTSPSCNARYELRSYLETEPPAAPPLLSPPPAPPAAPTPPPLLSKGRKTTWIAVGATGSAIIVLLLGSFLLWRRHNRDKGKLRIKKGLTFFILLIDGRNSFIETDDITKVNK